MELLVIIGVVALLRFIAGRMTPDEANPEAPQTTPGGFKRLDTWAKYDTKGYGPVEKESFFDPKIAKAHTTFFVQAEPKSERNPNWAKYDTTGYGPEEK